MIYCVVPQALADELYDKLAAYYEDDPHVDPIGAKGIAEVGIVGVAAAIANAVFNATGIRVRDLPVTPDKLIGRL